jgi:hypothetical protein
MRGIARVALVAVMALAVFASLGTPAYAALAGGGAVSGTVTITNAGCIPVATAAPGPVTYTFSDVVIPGVFANDAGQAFAGQIDVSNVKGASVAPHDNTVMGQGTVNSATDKATFTGSLPPNSISGTFFGKYLRVGSVVLVDLDVAGKVNNGTTQTTKVSVAAHFQPTNGDGVVQPVCAAAFGGVYATADNPLIT